MAQEGRMLPIGFACGRWGNISPVDITLKNLSVVGAVPNFPRDVMQQMQEHLGKLYRDGKIRMLIDREIGFDGIRDSLQDLADRKAHGRIIAVH
jgi:hypothetical protein